MRFFRPRKTTKPTARPTWTPRIEMLEDRAVPAVVMNTNPTGPGSLFDAISITNASTTDDVITFQASVTGTITLTGSLPAITDDLDLTGPGAANLTVSGNDAFRVFDIGVGGPSFNVSISGLTIASGKVVGGDGGGVRNNNANLNLTDLVIRDNKVESTVTPAVTASGGGVAVLDGSIQINRVQFTDNRAGQFGGGVYIGPLGGTAASVVNSSFAGNTAQSGGGIATVTQTRMSMLTFGVNNASTGSGISFLGNLGSPSFTDGLMFTGRGFGSLIDGQSVIEVESGHAVEFGTSVSGPSLPGLVVNDYYTFGPFINSVGNISLLRSTFKGSGTLTGSLIESGVASANGTSSLSIRESTFASNKTTAGGVVLVDEGQANFTNSTFVDNETATGTINLGPSAPTSNTQIAHVTVTRNSRGVVLGNGSVAAVRNSILALNTRSTGTPPTTVSENLTLGTGATLSVNTGNVIGPNGPSTGDIDPLVGPLLDNGDNHLVLFTIFTTGLLPGSPALGAGIPGVELRDQRFIERPAGGPTDAGAFQVRPTTLNADGPFSTSVGTDKNLGNLVGNDTKGEPYETLAARNVALSDPSFGQIITNADGTFTFRPAAGKTGTVNVSYTAGVRSNPATQTAAITIADATVPTATIQNAPNVTTATTTYDFTVRYADDLALNAGTFDGTDIRVTGPNGFNQLALFVSADVAGNGTPRVVTYRLTGPTILPGGDFNNTDNGTYTITVEAGKVLDTNGNAVPAGQLGTFTVNVPAPGAPGASLTAANVTAAANTYTFTVTYSGPTAIDAATFDNSDIVVTGPGGFSAAATKVSVDQPGNGTPRVVTYSITPPGGSFDSADNGQFTVTLQANQVRDTNGTAVAAAALGNFTVNIAAAVTRPTAVDDPSYTTAFNTALSKDAATGVLSNDTKFAGGTLTATLTTPPAAAQGKVTLNADGSFTFTPTTGFSGAATFQYTATENGVASAPATVTITVAFGAARLFAVGGGAGAGPRVKVFDETGAAVSDFFAFDQALRGGVRVATGDINGDGVQDVVAGNGPQGMPEVAIFDARTGREIRRFLAFEANVSSGVFVALADVTGDGKDDIVVSTGSGGAARIQVFDGPTGAAVVNFFAYDPEFRGGARIAAGDLNGDGRAELVTVPGPSGSPHVKVFTVAGGVATEAKSFFAFDPNYRGGTFVAVAGSTISVAADSSPDFSGSFLDLLFPGLPNFDGGVANRSTVSADVVGDPVVFTLAFDQAVNGGSRGQVTAYPAPFQGGVRLGSGKSASGTPLVYTATGSGGGSRVNIYTLAGTTLTQRGSSLKAFEDTFQGSVYVG